MSNTLFNHNRISIRLVTHDYTATGAYFITICTRDRENLFGEIANGRMRLDEIGGLAEKCWKEIPQHFDNATLDEFQIMPNHVHGIILINKAFTVVGTQHVVSLPRRFQQMVPKSISSIMRSYKAAVTKLCRRAGIHYFQWQSRFYDQIIRNTKELEQIRNYIRNNPLNWPYDEENTSNWKRSLPEIREV